MRWRRRWWWWWCCQRVRPAWPVRRRRHRRHRRPRQRRGRPTGWRSPLVGAVLLPVEPARNIRDEARCVSHLVPSQTPPSSLVNSSSPQTAARDIANAHKVGINFFAIDWWPYVAGSSGADYRSADKNMKNFLAAPDLHEMKFAMFYETWNLGFNPPYEATPVDPQMELHFDSDMLNFAKLYFDNPSYLRIEGRPVLDMPPTSTLHPRRRRRRHGRAKKREVPRSARLRRPRRSSSATRSTGGPRARERAAERGQGVHRAAPRKEWHVIRERSTP